MHPVENNQGKADQMNLGYKSRITDTGVIRYEKIIENRRNDKAINTNRVTVWIIVILTALNVGIELFRLFG